MTTMLDPLRNKDDEQRMYLIAEMAAKFVSRFIYTMRLNGVPEVFIPQIANTLSQNVIGTLWVDPAGLSIPKDQKTQLEEFDPADLVPN